MGEKVLTRDPNTGQQSYQTVTKKTVRTTDELVRITTEDGRSIESTPEHPFWVEGEGFIPARRLARSDLLTDSEGHESAVVSLEWKRDRFEVYNFEVEHSHTYYAGGWLVHNGCGRELVEAGKNGESAAGIVKNTERIPSLTGTAKYRVPDELLHESADISEVKDVEYQHYSSQLKDDVAYAKANGYTMRLYTTVATRLSKKLREVSEAGDIVHDNKRIGY